MDFLTKLKFLFKKPKIIIVTGEGRACAKEAIYQVLKPYFSASAPINRGYGGSAVALREGGKIGKEILIFDLKNSSGVEKFEFLIKNSSLPVLVVTHVGDIPFDKDFFAGEKEKTAEIRKLAKILPTYGYLILNFDDETIREIKDETNLKEITFGFGERADFRASDIKLNSGTNFKVNFEGKVVPIWLAKLFGKEQIYSALAACAIGTIFGLNLIEISQALKDYRTSLEK